MRATNANIGVHQDLLSRLTSLLIPAIDSVLSPATNVVINVHKDKVSLFISALIPVNVHTRATCAIIDARNGEI